MDSNIESPSPGQRVVVFVEYLLTPLGYIGKFSYMSLPDRYAKGAFTAPCKDIDAFKEDVEDLVDMFVLDDDNIPADFEAEYYYVDARTSYGDSAEDKLEFAFVCMHEGIKD